MGEQEAVKASSYGVSVRSANLYRPLFATPDITKAQVLAVLQAIIGLLVAFGIDVDQELQDAIVQLVTAVAVVLPLADALIRNGRARGSAHRS